jgi:hypothetical protein
VKTRRSLAALSGVAACVALDTTPAAGQLVPFNYGGSQENSPGLRCWGIRDGMNATAYVFAGPSTWSPRTVRIQSYAAVTGPMQNGFLPVVTNSGQRGWVMEEAVHKDGFPGASTHCVVQYLPSGGLKFIWGGPQPKP